MSHSELKHCATSLILGLITNSNKATSKLIVAATRYLLSSSMLTNHGISERTTGSSALSAVVFDSHCFPCLAAFLYHHRKSNIARNPWDPNLGNILQELCWTLECLLIQKTSSVIGPNQYFQYITVTHY